MRCLVEKKLYSLVPSFVVFLWGQCSWSMRAQIGSFTFWRFSLAVLRLWSFQQESTSSRTLSEQRQKLEHSYLGATVCWTNFQRVSWFIWWAAHKLTRRSPRIWHQAKWTLSDTRLSWFQHFRAFWHRRSCYHTQLRSTQSQRRTYRKEREIHCNNNWWYEKFKKCIKWKKGGFSSFWYLCFLSSQVD